MSTHFDIQEVDSLESPKPPKRIYEEKYAELLSYEENHKEDIEQFLKDCHLKSISDAFQFNIGTSLSHNDDPFKHLYIVYDLIIDLRPLEREKTYQYILKRYDDDSLLIMSKWELEKQYGELMIEKEEQLPNGTIVTVDGVNGLTFSVVGYWYNSTDNEFYYKLQEINSSNFLPYSVKSSNIKSAEIKKVAEEKGSGQRLDSGKLDITQCPIGIQAYISAVLMLNSKKYGGKYDNKNWANGMDWSKVYNPAMRHFLKWLQGEQIDEESGLPHLAHLAANIAFLIEYEKSYPEGDDRFKKTQVTLDDVQKIVNQIMEKRK